MTQVWQACGMLGHMAWHSAMVTEGSQPTAFAQKASQPVLCSGTQVPFWQTNPVEQGVAGQLVVCSGTQVPFWQTYPVEQGVAGQPELVLFWQLPTLLPSVFTHS
jgi:hypothetical protein